MADDNARIGNVQGAETWVPRPDPTVLTAEAVSVTKQDLRREMAALRELMEARLGSLEDLIAPLRESISRHPAEWQTQAALLQAELDRRIKALTEQDDRISATAKDEVAHLLTLHQERFTSFAQQFAERDIRSERDKHALDATVAEARSEIDRAVTSLERLHTEKFNSIELQFHERDVRTAQSQLAADQALNAALQAAKELVNAQSQASTDAAVKSETSFTKQIDQIGVQLQSVQAALDARITELKERIDRGEGGDKGSSDTSKTMISVFGLLLTVVSIIVIVAVATHGFSK